MKILLNDKRVDPSDLNNDAVIWAFLNNHTEAMEIILSDHRFKMTDNLYKSKSIMNMIYQIRQEKLNELMKYEK